MLTLLLLSVLGQDRTIGLPDDRFAGDPRVALVIGNAAYQQALPNPVKDARAMRDVLTSMGFKVFFSKVTFVLRL